MRRTILAEAWCIAQTLCDHACREALRDRHRLDKRIIESEFMERIRMANRRLVSATILGAALSSACISSENITKLAAPDRASEIVYGTVDDANTFSNVGAFVLRRKSDGAIFPICSGTLISPTVFLTAGHCTIAYEDFADDFTAGVSFDNPIPWGALTSNQTKVAVATDVITNPTYNFTASDPRDLGVLILESRDTRGITPATLPTLGLLDQLFAQGLLLRSKFTAVGYGVQDRIVGTGGQGFQDSNPVPRRYALSSFNALGPAMLRLSQNVAKGDGGTCYGDSGGPNFLTIGSVQVLAATTVTGDNTCRATNVDYRVDTPAARQFLGQYVQLP
jgi:hypothetical protein